jgi:hypothetical protein
VSSPLQNVLDRLEHVRRTRKGWIACCPAHDDRHSSLSIGVGDDGHRRTFLQGRGHRAAGGGTDCLTAGIPVIITRAPGAVTKVELGELLDQVAIRRSRRRVARSISRRGRA